MVAPGSKLPTVALTDSLRSVIAMIDEVARGIALVVDAEQHLLGTITDGDVRRAILAGLDLEATVAELLARRPPPPSKTPVTALPSTPPQELLRLMARHSVRQIPILDEARRLVNLVVADDLLPNLVPPPQAVVMAGGFGTRLRPLTDNLPKPMLPVGGKPLLEHIVGQLRDAGIGQLHFTTHYMPESISGHFGDGHRFGVNISYVNEERPLGTAGALSLLPPWKSTLLVINGDILTGIDFQAMQAFHRDQHAAMTVAVRAYDMTVPYGVMDIEGVDIRHLDEKPRLRFFVNAGIYLLEPEAHACIPTDRRFDMTDLIQALLASGRRVTSFALRESWLDIGRLSDYEKANEEFGHEPVAAPAAGPLAGNG